MHIVLFAHPDFINSESMPRFVNMLANGMQKKGHIVEIWAPKGRFAQFGKSHIIQKWLGYIDQFIIFPIEVRSWLKRYPSNTLFVITDNALGPWVPLIAHRRHIIHCHDFLAQQSALGKIHENITSWTGRRYQSFIRRGYEKGKYFISVSNKTRHDLHQLLENKPYYSEVLYNGLNKDFTPTNSTPARQSLSATLGLNLASGYILHVGGNQWYKNRHGVIDIYEAFRNSSDSQLPLLLIGEPPNNLLLSRYNDSLFKNDIHWLINIDDHTVQLAYSGASVFLFPSIAEGFGWPIIEAMASNCPVVTTQEAPMTEIAGEAAFLIPRRPTNEYEVSQWATKAANVLRHAIELTHLERQAIILKGQENAKRFSMNEYFNKLESIYQNIDIPITR